jgi:Na+-transporting methylmalonyl-CoA/oxaloacetate decarboxylase gamma subunit
MFLANALGESHLGIGTAFGYALLGYAVVFFGLILLMIVVIAMGKVFIARDKKAAAKAAAAKADISVASVAEVTAPVAEVPAPGTAGQLKLYDTPPKTAAMIMAIVADKMGKPLNELRFISIKEVK